MATIKEWKRDFRRLKKWQKVTTIIAIICVVCIPITIWLSNRQHAKIAKNHTEAKEDRKEIMEGIKSILKRQEKDVAPDIIEKEAQRTYEIVKNFNANFLIKKGYEKKGGMGTWFTPMWEEQPQRKFYLMDFVGNLDKNRISVFITKESLLICQVLTSDGRKTDLLADISTWKKDAPHLIIVQWQTEKNKVQLFVDKKEYVEIIPNLNFDVLGPLVFIGIDFEGKFPAHLREGGPKISEGLKSIGLSEYKQ